MNTDPTDRTITFRLHCNKRGAQVIFRLLAAWMNESPNYRFVDLFEQRVDGVPIEDEDHDFTKELQKTSRYPDDRGHY